MPRYYTDGDPDHPSLIRAAEAADFPAMPPYSYFDRATGEYVANYGSGQSVILGDVSEIDAQAAAALARKITA